MTKKAWLIENMFPKLKYLFANTITCSNILRILMYTLKSIYELNDTFIPHR